LRLVPESFAVPELPGLAIEAVEWLPSGAESGLVRVRGRWEEGAVPQPGLPALVVGGRRFESLPEAPGARPEGEWRGTYLVPAALMAAEFEALSVEWPSGARAGLPTPEQGIEPPSVEPGEPAPEKTGGEVIERAVLAERRARRAEEESRNQARVAAEALKAVEVLELRSAELERRLEQAADARDERAAELERRLQEATAERDARAAETSGRREALAAALSSAAALRSRARDWQLRMRSAEVARTSDAVRLAVLEAERATDAGALRAALHERSRELEVRRREADARAAELATASAAAAGLRAELQAARDEIEALEAEGRESAAELWRIRDEAAREGERRAELERDLAAARTDGGRAEARARALEGRLTGAESRLQTAEAALAAAESRLRVEAVARATFEEQLDRERAGRQAEVAAARADLEALPALRAEVDSARVEADTARAERDTARAEADTARAEADTARAERDAALAQVEALRSERDAAVAQVEALRSEREAAVAQVEALRSERDAAVADLDAARTELERLRSQHDEALAELGTARSVIADLEGMRPAGGSPEDLRRMAAEQVAAAERESPADTSRVVADLDAAADALRRSAEPPPGEPPAAEPPPGEPPAAEPPPAAAVASPAAGDASPAATPGDAPAPIQARAAPRIVSATREPARGLVVGTAKRQYPPLRGAIVKLAHDDPATAGRLLAALLPAQGPLIGAPLAYDVTIGGVGTFAVNVAGRRASVERIDSPRPRRQAAFHLTGDPLTLAELLAGVNHRVRRFRGAVRVRGRRRRLAALRGLTTSAQTLAEAARAGAKLEPELVYRALVYAIHPTWTRGHEFTIAQEIVSDPPETWYLTAREGGGLSVSATPPADPPEATVTMTRTAFDRLLRDEPVPSGERPIVRGDHAAVDLMRAWTLRAQGLDD
jgi:hypothetical protein